jgi:2-polyprenyl-3-methyl-5-hydroxy-6-metoxy-1,4-benzoquinol methylase
VAATDFDARARTWDADPAKLERARKVADLMAAHVPGLASARVLEYGAGTGLLGFALAGRASQVTLADSSQEMLAVAREKLAARGAANVAVVALDLARGEVPDRRFDVVCSLLVLHHVADTDGLLSRFHELLEPGGFLCVSDLDAEDGSFHGPGFDGHSGFDRVRLAASLARAGFEDVRLETAFEIGKGGRTYPAFLAVARRKA